MVYLQHLADIMVQKNRGLPQKTDILVVGGSALALKYASRYTVDIDADIRYKHKISDSIADVARVCNISDDWLNQEFTKSESYSWRLWDNAIFICTLNSFMNIYVVSDLDQLCMKATAGRRKDIDDIELLVRKCKEHNIGYREYSLRMQYLYGGTVKAKSSAERFIRKQFAK